MLTAWVVMAAAQDRPQGSENEAAKRAMCDAALPMLRESNTTQVVLMMTLDGSGRVRSFKTESPKGLRLEKMKDTAAAIKKIRFQPAKKDGSPVAVQVRIAFDCATQPTRPSTSQ